MTGIDSYNNIQERRIFNSLEKYPYLTGYYAYIANTCQPTTAYVYLNQVKRFHDYTKKMPEQLTFADFSMYMMKAKKTENGAAAERTSVLNVYHALEWYGKYLKVSGVMSTDPMETIPRPRGKESMKTKTKRDKGYLNENEIAELIQNVKTGAGRKASYMWSERDYAIILLFLTTGFRCSALYKIDVEDINFETGVLTVTDKGGYVKYYNLPTITMDAIRMWIVKRNELPLIDTEALFTSSRMVRMSNTAIANVVKKYSESITAATGKVISPHKLRATYGTQLYEKTKDIYFVQQCMGHASPTTTELYVRGKKNQSGTAANIMQDIIRN